MEPMQKVTTRTEFNLLFRLIKELSYKNYSDTHTASDFGDLLLSATLTRSLLRLSIMVLKSAYAVYTLDTTRWCCTWGKLRNSSWSSTYHACR